MARTRDTETSYIERAMGFELRVARMLKVKHADPRDVAAMAIEKKKGWTRSTWRQIKASLIFYYETMDGSEALSAISLLENTSEAGCKRASMNTSARRKKETADEDFLRVFAAIRKSGSPYAGILEVWMRLGAITGLRPHEWSQSWVIETLGNMDGGPFLRVLNSKNTNGRAHGEYRHLDLCRCEPVIIDMIRKFSGHMRAIHRGGEYQRMYKACTDLLRIANRSVFGANAKWIQLYSPRHKFSSNAKISTETDELAAMMGHATDRTAGLHYGTAKSASGGLMIRPVSSETAKIKRKAPEWTAPPRQSRAGSKKTG